MHALLHDWSTYVAYLAAFLSIAAIWVTHHNAFTRIERADPVVLVLNLLILLGTSLVPWPTALLAAAIGNGRYEDEVAAIVVYTTVSLIVCTGWVFLGLRLASRPHLLVAPMDATGCVATAAPPPGAGVFAIMASAIGFVAPVVALALFFAVPLGWLLLAVRADAPITQSTRQI